MSKTSKADKAKPEADDAPDYGEVRPTMVNGRPLDPVEPEAPKQLSLGDRIRRAFPSEMQIAVLLELLEKVEPSETEHAESEVEREGTGGVVDPAAPTGGDTTDPKA